jgi:phosphoribosylamine--glycine ligase
MNYLIFSRVGCGYIMIPRLQKASDTEKVYYFNQDMSQTKQGKGMENYPGWEKLERTTDPFKIINSTPKDNLIIIFDDNGFGSCADYLRKDGYNVVGGSALADRLENDRWWALQVARKIMNIPESEYYNSFDEGITALKAKEKTERWVFKPQDNDAPKDKTYVGKDIFDLIEAMRRFKEEWEWKDGFVLQKFVDGAMSSFNAYFDGKDWLKDSFGWYLENKPFMTGDNGPATGGEIAVQIWRKNEGPIFDILNKLKPMLQKDNYHGQMDINAIFSKEDHKPYFLEFTSRFGYPGVDLETTALEENGYTLADLIKQLAFGGKNALFPTNKVATVLTVSVPPYPLDEGAKTLTSGLPVKWAEKYDRYFFPWNTMFDKKKGQVLCGTTGHTLSITCIDDTLDGAKAMTYDTYLPTVELKDKQYRTDMTDDAKRRLKDLKDWGIL